MTTKAAKGAAKLAELTKDARAKQKVADKAFAAANKAWAKVEAHATKSGLAPATPPPGPAA